MQALLLYMEYRCCTATVLRNLVLQGQPFTSSATKKKQPGSSNGNSSSVAPSANGHTHSFDIAAGPAPPSSSFAQQEHEPLPPDLSEQQQQDGHVQEHSSSYKQSKFNSLDYELVENTVYRTDAAGRTHLDHIMEGGVKWTICFALGEGANLVSS